MPLADTAQFGSLPYRDEAALEFPCGLPGFEQARRFVLIQQPDWAPLVHLQSLQQPELCFLALPVHLLDPGYELQLLPGDREVLGTEVREDAALLCLALLAVTAETRLSANLLAPVVVNVAARRAVQAIRGDCRYSHQHLLGPAPWLGAGGRDGGAACW